MDNFVNIFGWVFGSCFALIAAAVLGFVALRMFLRKPLKRAADELAKGIKEIKDA